MCLCLAVASLALQLAGAAWRLLGQLAAAQQLLFALLRPAWLQRVHTFLAGALASLGRGMQRLALVDTPLTRGGWPLYMRLPGCVQLIMRAAAVQVDCSWGPNSSATCPCLCR